MTERKILLTGAHGLLGQAFAAKFCMLGWRLVTTSRQRHRVVRDVVHVSGDLSNYAHVERILKQGPFDVVIHAAARISPTDEDGGITSLFRDNVVASANLALAASQNQIPHFIYCSTISVYSGDGPYSEQSETAPLIPYGISKLTTENVLRNLASDKFAVTVLRFAGLHGFPRRSGVFFNFVQAALNNAPITVAEPNSVYNLTFMADAVMMLQQAATANPRDAFEIYNAANLTSMRLSCLAERVIRICKSNSKIINGDGAKRNKVLLVDKILSSLGVSSSSVDEEILAMASMPQHNLDR